MLLDRVISLISDGKSVILDWGFWKKKEREMIREKMMNCRANVKLIYFKVNREEMEKRINSRELLNNHIITSNMLDGFFNEFEEPSDEKFKLFNP